MSQFWMQPGHASDNLVVVAEDEVVVASLGETDLDDARRELEGGGPPRGLPGPTKRVHLADVYVVFLDPAFPRLHFVHRDGAVTKDTYVSFAHPETRDAVFQAIGEGRGAGWTYREANVTPWGRVQASGALWIAGIIAAFTVLGALATWQVMDPGYKPGPSRRGAIAGAIFTLVGRTIGPVGLLVVGAAALLAVGWWVATLLEVPSAGPVRSLSRAGAC